MKKILQMISIIVFVLFLILFLNKNNNYYENERVLTEEAITRFEQDLKEGKKIVPSNYISEKKDYNNKASRLGMKCSSMIEKTVNKALKKVLASIDSN